MNRVTPGATRGVTLSSTNGLGDRSNAATIPNKSRSPQYARQQSNVDDGIHIGAIWKSPRDKRACIQASVKSYNDSPPYLDLRVFEMDAQGRMQPTHKGITCSMQRLPQLAKLVGDAMRKAHAAGLITGASS